MKLVLMALMIEICSARIFVTSWEWAVLIAVLYCIIVYVRQTILMKRQNKPGTEPEDIMIQEFRNDNQKNQLLPA